MIIFLYGEDSYRARQKLKEIVDRYKKVHKSGLNLKYLDFSDKDSENGSPVDFFSNFRQESMFSEKKLFVVINPFNNAGSKAMFSEYAKKSFNSDDLVVALETGKIEKKETLFKFLRDKAKSQEFLPLSGVKLKSWIEKKFEACGAKAEPLAINKLIDYVGSDLWRMSGEINKLANYKKGGAVESGDIELLVRSKIENDIFKTIDAISAKDKKTAINLMHRHIEKGDPPLYLLSMICYQFRNLLIIKDLIERRNPYELIAGKSGLHPYVVKKNYYACQKFSLSDLKKIYRTIFQVDLDIKTGKIDPNLALDLLIEEM